MIELEIAHPLSVSPICLGLLLTLIIPIIIATYFLIKGKSDKEYGKPLIFIGILFIITSLYFIFIQYRLINKYWYYYDYSLALFLQTVFFLILIIIFPIIILGVLKFDSNKTLTKKKTLFHLNNCYLDIDYGIFYS